MGEGQVKISAVGYRVADDGLSKGQENGVQRKSIMSSGINRRTAGNH